MLTIGDAFGDYVIEDYLDEGGHAHIFVARHRERDTVHALKVLHSKRNDIRRRFMDEGRTLMKLVHPNIVPVLEVIEVEDRPALVLEYVDGMALDHWINEGLHDWDERKHVIKGLIDGLGHAHAHGVVHRDLQPANVLITKGEDGLFVARLIDFGLAKDPANDRTTRTGATLGTPGYMAPEQIRNSKDVDVRADMFSLGCLIYVVVCEAEPFDGANDVETYNATCEGRYIAPERMAPEVPELYHVAIKRCLEVDRDTRISSVAALRAVLAGEPEPTEAPAPLPPEPTLPQELVRRVPPWGPALLITLMLLGVALIGWFLAS